MNDLVIPFAPSLTAACSLVAGIPCLPAQGKEFARTMISGGRLLSVPVVGGASRLKRRPDDLTQIMISDHGAWRREHLGAWNAAYGKAPFFNHLFPLIEEAYINHSHDTLAEFNGALWKVATDFLEIERILPALHEADRANPARFRAIREEMTTKVNLNYSIFDPIFRLGKNTVFIL